MKTEVTIALEEQIYKSTAKQGVFGCFEVTIGWFGNERVDYLTYDTKGIWRCYEIKASVSDFRSPAAKTFIGHFNYFVMPREIYEKVKDEIPSGIGVIINGMSVVKAKRRELGVDEQILKDSMIRSLAREYQQTRRSENRGYITRINRELKEAQRSLRASERYYYDFRNAVINKYGLEAYRELKKGEPFE